MERPTQIIMTTVAVSIVVHTLPLPRPAASRGKLGRQLTASISDKVCRGLWNTSYAVWQATVLGHGAQPSRY